MFVLFCKRFPQSTVGNKMAAVHFITIPCEPNTANKTQGKPNFYNICPCTKDIVYRRFEDFITLLYLFMNVVKVFVRLELWVTVYQSPSFFLRRIVGNVLFHMGNK